MVDQAVLRTIAEARDLVDASAAHRPKAWGALAARGVVTFRELAGRTPSEAERRAIWAGLWRAVVEADQHA